MHYAITLSAPMCSYTLGPAESELEEPTEQVHVEGFTNLVWIKASPGASHPILGFYF
jgi:hypothetical protein